MNVMGTPPPIRPRSPLDVSTPRTPRTFLLRDDLVRAFETRARELECSVDWLAGEALKRFLSETGTGLPARPVAPPKPPPLVSPPPRPTRPPIAAAIALRLGTARAVVDSDRFVVGRSAKHAQLVIADPNVSRQHAMIERTARGWMIVDMASTNGVLLNGARVTRAPIKAGDVLEIGPARIVVEHASGPERW